MRGYELCLIFHPEVAEEQIEKTLNTLSKAITDIKGSIIQIEKKGKKNLKFTIEKQSKGCYYFLYFKGGKETLGKIEEIVKFNEVVLRWNVLRLEKKALIAYEKAAITTQPEETKINSDAQSADMSELEDRPSEKTDDNSGNNPSEDSNNSSDTDK